MALWANYPMTGGSLLDISGNGRDLVRSNGSGGSLTGPVAALAGPSGVGSLRFGPHQNSDGGANQPSHGLQTPNFASSVGSYLVEMWVKIRALPVNSSHTYSLFQNRPSGSNFWCWVTDDDRLWVWNGSSSQFSSVGAIPIGTWTHVAVSRDATIDQGKIWIDGVDVFTFSPSLPFNGSSALSFGADFSDWSITSFCDKVLDGDMADVKIWDNYVVPDPGVSLSVPLLRQRQVAL